MVEVATFFKPGTPGGPAPTVDDRIPVWGSSLKQRPGGGLRRNTGRRRTVPGSISDARAGTVRRLGGFVCEATEHAPGCPGVCGDHNWVVHHIWPRSLGGPDFEWNLAGVWCPGRRGLNGCHGLAHRQGSGLIWRPRSGVEFGELAAPAGHPRSTLPAS